MQIDQQRDSEGSWIVKKIREIKRYIKKRPLLKYSSLGVGGLLCSSTVVVAYVYTYRKKTKPEEDGTFLQELLKNKENLGIALEVKDKSIEELEKEMKELKKDMKKMKRIDMQNMGKKENNLNVVLTKIIAENKIIATTIEKNMTYDKFCDIYYEKIYKKELCKDLLCGRCSGCQWTDYGNKEFYSLLLDAAEAMNSPVVLYDTVIPLKPIFKDSVEVYSNIEEIIMRKICEMMMVDDILYMRLTFTSLKSKNIEAIPMICTIFIEGQSRCFGYRFRVRNTVIPDLIFIEDSFKKMFKYSGYNIPAIIKSLAMSIVKLKRNKTLCLEFTLQPNDKKDVFYTSEPILKRRSSEMFLYLTSLKEPVSEAIFAILISLDKSEVSLETIPKYRFINLISQFGQKKDAIEFSHIFSTLSTEPIKYVASTLTSAREWLGRLFKNNQIKKPDEVGYTSEPAHGLTVLSSICAWKYEQDERVTLTVHMENGKIKFISGNGIKVLVFPELEHIIEYLTFLKSGLLFSRSLIGKFASNALLKIKRAEIYKKNSVSIFLDINKEKVIINIWTNERKKEAEESFGFLIPNSIYNALKIETKEQWIFSLLKALVFSQYAIKKIPLTSVYVEEKTKIGNFFVEQEKDKKKEKNEIDILDSIYKCLNNPKNNSVLYTLFILNDTVLVKIVQIIEGVKEEEIYIHVDSLLAKGFSSVLGSTFSFGSMNKKDFNGLIVQDLVFTKKLESYSNLLLVKPDFFYSRAYIMGRGIMNVLKHRTIGALEMKGSSYKYIETFSSWLSSLGQFGSISLLHPFLYYIMDFKKGMRINFEIRLLSKKVKSQAETTCKIEVSSGNFKEEIKLEYLEMTSPSSESKVENSLRLLFSKILGLSPQPSDSVLTVSLISFPASTNIDIVITTTQYPGKHEITIDYDKTKELGEQLIKETEDLFKSKLPIIINGNISIPLNIIQG